MRALRWTDAFVLALGVVLIVVHFIVHGLLSALISPWIIGSLVIGWLFARIALDRIERF
ncbi:MAG: hypothetical protein ACR2PL_27485 [Dehalococcoidia bacterium]